MIEKVHITDEKVLDYRFTSSVNDNTFDFEVWHNNNCLMVFRILEDSNIKIYFGKLENYTIDNKLLMSVMKKAKERLTTKLKDWLDSKFEI